MNRVRGEETPSEAIKRLVAEKEECSVVNLGTLSDVVGVDELNRPENLPLEFQYCGYQITLNNDETIKIDP